MIVATVVKTQECVSYGAAVSSTPLGLKVGMVAGVWRKASRRSAFQTCCNSKQVLDGLITLGPPPLPLVSLPRKKVVTSGSRRKEAEMGGKYRVY